MQAPNYDPLELQMAPSSSKHVHVLCNDGRVRRALVLPMGRDQNRVGAFDMSCLRFDEPEMNFHQRAAGLVITKCRYVYNEALLKAIRGAKREVR